MKRGGAKNCAGYFEIRKYAFFLIFEKRDEQKNSARYFEIRKCAFLKYLNKVTSKKTVPGILIFVSMLFNVIIF